MDIKEITQDKKAFLPLLLLGDEQESMIDQYLERGRLFALYDDELRSVCVVTDEGEGVLEIKNIAVARDFQRMGYGRSMIDFLLETFSGAYRVLRAGTGDSPLTTGFYERLGFHRADVIRDFFTTNYDHPILECGVELRDMIIYEREI